MAVHFLGYIDTPEELLGAKRRCLFGVDSADDIDELPSGEGFELPNGSVTAVPAAFSMAYGPGGMKKVLIESGSWEDL